MSYYKFEDEDILHNQLQLYPENVFVIYDTRIYYNNQYEESGSQSETVKHVPHGGISLYELNINRQTNNLCYPFVLKDSSRTSFRNVTSTSFNSDFAFGDTITGSYPLSATISRDYYETGQVRPQIEALRNTIEYYRKNSPEFVYSSDARNLSSSILTLISIPSIFYGSSIKKGSVSLQFYVTGTLIGELQDIRQNGELIQVGPTGSTGSGSVQGLALYNEGFFLLTGSTPVVNLAYDRYEPAGGVTTPKWVHFAATGSNYSMPSSSFQMSFKGTFNLPTLTMFAHARKGMLNNSNNPTFLHYGSASSDSYQTMTSSISYREDARRPIKNTTKTIYPDVSGSFEKQVFISKVGVYDEDKNLIGIANLATPVRKRESDSFTIKMKLDL